MQRAGQGPDRPGPAPGPHLDRVPPPRRGLHVRPRLRRHPQGTPAHHGPDRRGSASGKRPDHEPGPATTTRDSHWRQLTTVADVVTLLGAWLQPTRDRLATV